MTIVAMRKLSQGSFFENAWLFLKNAWHFKDIFRKIEAFFNKSKIVRLFKYIFCGIEAF
jgi:hypothetical protein